MPQAQIKYDFRDAAPKAPSLANFDALPASVTALAQDLRAPSPPTAASRFVKRAFDIVGTLVLSFGLAPFLLLIALRVKKDDGPIFFRQQRVGKDGQVFSCYKFRSMRPNADKLLILHLENNPHDANEWQQFQKLRKDARVTEFGHFLRRTSLDELPQLWNVLIGDMSLVGPRPCLPSQAYLYGKGIVFYQSLRPGITGPWQVGGRNKLSFEQRVVLECDYVRNRSLWLDIIILLKTFPALFRKDEAF